MSDPTESTDLAGLAESARLLARQLAETRTRLVLAESCTGGLAAATLAAIPGISHWLCGSAVTYREPDENRLAGCIRGGSCARHGGQCRSGQRDGLGSPAADVRGGPGGVCHRPSRARCTRRLRWDRVAGRGATTRRGGSKAPAQCGTF